MIKSFKEYKSFLKKHLNKDRYNHSISTAKFMKKYAECYNIDKGKAYIAGLLHDLAKEFSSAEILKLSTKFKKRKICNIEYFDFKKKHAFLLHGAAAAEIMYTELKIKDPEILQAVVHHTLGGKNLSILSKFTFMADYCEPLRDYKLSKDIYNMLVKEKDFNKAYFYTYVYLIERILKKENYICLESIDGYNDALMYYKK